MISNQWHLKVEDTVRVFIPPKWCLFPEGHFCIRRERHGVESGSSTEKQWYYECAICCDGLWKAGMEGDQHQTPVGSTTQTTKLPLSC